MAIHSSILAWKSPWTEESGGLQSMGLHDWAFVHEDKERCVGSNKLVELKNKINKTKDAPITQEIPRDLGALLRGSYQPPSLGKLQGF